MLSYDGNQFQGIAQIMEKLLSMPKVRHNPAACDIQPTLNGVICFVTGDLFIDEDTNPIKLSQVFNIVPNEAGGYYCNPICNIKYRPQ